jgi:Zn-finger nucleic acid-binding protein
MPFALVAHHPRYIVIESDNKKKINTNAFLEDFIRGASEEELRKKYSLSHSQATRIIEILKGKGKITAEVVSRRQENLKVRFGSEQGPSDESNKVAVDLNTGLALHCPSCGAVVKRDAPACDYCAAALDFSRKGKTVHCPHCMADTPADGRFCIRCARPVLGRVKEGLALEDRLCPRCSIPMRGMRVGSFSLIVCARCKGTFVPHEVFEMMQETSDRIVFSTDFARRPELNQNETVRYVRCPVCRTLMNRTNFAKISGVIIDTCKGHGIWFDPGEIEKIMDFIARGGLVKAKEADLQRLKDEKQIMKIKNMPTAGSGDTSSQDWGFFSDPHDVDIVDVLRWVFEK